MPRVMLRVMLRLDLRCSKGKAYAHYVYPLRVAPALMY